MNSRKILSCDIGGTSARFALSEFQPSGEVVSFRSTWFKTADFADFGTLLSGALSYFAAPQDLAAVVVAAAGPVENGLICSPPNIPWKINLGDVTALLPGVRPLLINDFLAQAYSCVTSVGLTAKLIKPGTAAAGAIGVIGAGTGLGKALLTPLSSGRYLGGPSEGGHAHFGIENDEDFALAQFIKKKLGARYVTWEHVVCGAGLSRVHEFLTGKELSPADVASGLAEGGRTLELFAGYYGRACRDLALEFLATGGVFIAGGVAARNPNIVEHEAFSNGFNAAQTHGALLGKIPIFLIDNQESGLIGAAYYGFISD